MKQFLMTLLFFSSLAITNADAQSCCTPTPSCCKPNPTCCTSQKSAKAGKAAAATTTCTPEQMQNCSPEEIEACLSGGLLASASTKNTASNNMTTGKKSNRRPVTKTVAARQE